MDFLNRILAKDWFHRAAGSPLFRKMVLTGERFLLPGIIIHYLARKVHIKREVDRAIRQGRRRVVVLGAGYDSLAWRLQHKHPGVTFIEMDHPATQRLKAASLGESRNLTLISLDLGSDLPSSQLINDGLPTAFVVEGLTMDLTPARVAALVTNLARISEKGGRIIWTFMKRSSTARTEDSRAIGEGTTRTYSKANDPL